MEWILAVLAEMLQLSSAQETIRLGHELLWVVFGMMGPRSWARGKSVDERLCPLS